MKCHGGNNHSDLRVIVDFLCSTSAHKALFGTPNFDENAELVLGSRLVHDVPKRGEVQNLCVLFCLQFNHIKHI